MQRHCWTVHYPLMCLNVFNVLTTRNSRFNRALNHHARLRVPIVCATVHAQYWFGANSTRFNISITKSNAAGTIVQHWTTHIKQRYEVWQIYSASYQEMQKKSTNRYNGCTSGTQEVITVPKQGSVPHKTTPTIYTSAKGTGDRRKRKTWKNSKGGAKSSEYCNKRVNQPHGPNNSNHNAQHFQTNWRWVNPNVYPDTGPIIQNKALIQLKK